jgi:hypothetical protein
MPSKSTSFTPSSILVRPRPKPARSRILALGGGAGYCPRVRKVYYDGHLSPYPACAGTSLYRRRRLTNKDPLAPAGCAGRCRGAGRRPPQINPWFAGRGRFRPLREAFLSESTQIPLQPSRIAPKPLELFIAFSLISVSGFGGVLYWSRRMMVDERKWMTAEEFNEAYGLCNFLPGPNIVNFSVVFGRQVGGAVGRWSPCWAVRSDLHLCVFHRPNLGSVQGRALAHDDPA